MSLNEMVKRSVSIFNTEIRKRQQNHWKPSNHIWFSLSMSVTFRLNNQWSRIKGFMCFLKILTILETAESFTAQTTNKATAWAYVRLLCNRDENIFNAMANCANTSDRIKEKRKKKRGSRNANKITTTPLNVFCLFRNWMEKWIKN